MTVTIDIAIHHAGVGIGPDGVLDGQHLAGSDQGTVCNGLSPGGDGDGGILIHRLDLRNQTLHRGAQGEAGEVAVREAQIQLRHIVIGLGRLGIRLRLGVGRGLRRGIGIRLVLVLIYRRGER